MKRCTIVVAAFVILFTHLSTSHAQLYWDINGANPGATDDGGGLAAGTWDAPAMLTGDYNGNGVVDAADYVLWRKTPANFGGDVGYTDWRANFGRTGGGGGGTANWSTDSSGASPTVTWSAGQRAVFSAGTNASGTFDVTLSGAQSAGGVTFEEGAVTLTGSGLNLTGTGVVDTASGVTGTINSAIGGAVGVNKTGAGTLVLGGANTYTGSTTMATSSGILKLAATNTLPAATVLNMPPSSGGAVVELHNGGIYHNQTIAGITGGGSGTTTPTVVDVGFATLTIDVPSGQSHRYDGYLKTDFTDPATRGKVIKKGQGDLTLGGLNNDTTLGIGGEFSMEEGRLIYVNNVGTGGSNLLRPSQLTLKGGTIVKNLATPATSMSVTPRTLEIAGSFTMDMNGSEGNAQFLPSAPGSGVGGINLTVDNPTITVFGEVRSFPTNTPLGFIPSFILSGIITDGDNSYGLTKAGTGTLNLNSVNTYNGTTTIAEGNLRLTAVGGVAPTMGDGPVVLSGGNLEYTGAAIAGAKVLTLNNPVTMTSSSGVGHRTGSGAGGLSNTGPNVDVVFNSFVATGGTLTLYNDGSSNEPSINPPGPYGAALDFRVGFAGTGFDFTQPVVTVNHTDTDVPNRKTYLMSSNITGSHTFSGMISGNGGYVRNGAGGTSILTGNNTYTGDTKVLAGTLSITNPFLADTADVLLITGGILDLNFVGTDTIDQLFIDTFSQPTGTWGTIGSGAMNESPLITGTGRLQVSNPGSGLGASVVPEPSTASLVLFFMGVLTAGRPRRPYGRR